MTNVKILDAIQKAAVRTAYAEGTTKTQLAKQFGVSVRTIGRVLGKTLVQQPVVVKQKKEVKPKMIGSSSFITIVSREGKTHIADSSHPNFDKAYELLKKGDVDGALVAISTKDAIRVYSKGNIKIVGHQLLYKDVVFDVGITKRIIREMYNERPFEHLVNFFERLMNNPSRDAVYQLYGFLEHNDIELTPEGKFIAWKRVGDDFYDLRTHTFDNSAGKVVEMPRNMVDEDKNSTCSNGLHVAAKSYLPHYGGGHGNIIACLVDPADVVAIPADYDNAKMRVCKYVSLGVAQFSGSI